MDGAGGVASFFFKKKIDHPLLMIRGTCPSYTLPEPLHTGANASIESSTRTHVLVCKVK
jgi:hypothetical protein